MPTLKQSIVAAATIAMSGHSYAQSSISRTCPIASSGICYELNIPEATANSGTGDIFFSISAPTTFEWVGLGQGQGMAGSNIFLVYTSANGQNVTVSTRSGVGHVEPRHGTTGAQIEVLEGSGVSNGTMTANVRCSNCNSWSGGTMDFAGTSGSWIHAELAGTPLNSDDLAADIGFHSEYGVFNWDFAAAKGGNTANPFLASNNAVSNGTTSGASGSSTEPANFNTIMLAHGVMGCLAFAFVFPVGAILIRLTSFTGAIWVHAGIQLLGYALFICVFGMGLWMAVTDGYTSADHAIVGYVIFALMVLQPVGGLLHHLAFKKTGSRSIWSHGHIWSGRIAIILGMVNGGLGLQLAGSASTAEMAGYGVVAGVFGVAFLASAAFGEYKKAGAQPAHPSEAKYDVELRDGSSSEHKAP